MRTLSALAIALLLLPAAATALVPVPGDLRVPWYNGDLDNAIPAPTFGVGFNLHNARIGDLNDNNESEIIINGHAFGAARFAKSHFPGASATRLLLPATTQLEFDIESRANGSCFVYHDIRVILLGALDPLPVLDTLYPIAPLLPVDYYNDEVLAFSAQFTGKTLQVGHVVLDPMQAKMVGGGFPGLTHPFNSMSQSEKEIFLSQHFLAVWVFYAAAYENGTSDPNTECAFDNFAYVL